MAKRFTDRLKEKIGVKEGEKNGPGSAPKEERKNIGAEGAKQGEAAQAAQKKPPRRSRQSCSAGGRRSMTTRTCAGWWDGVGGSWPNGVCRGRAARSGMSWACTWG